MKRKSTGSDEEEGGEDKRFKQSNGHISHTSSQHGRGTIMLSLRYIPAGYLPRGTLLTIT